jgi:hypothetical protein
LQSTILIRASFLATNHSPVEVGGIGVVRLSAQAAHKAASQIALAVTISRSLWINECISIIAGQGILTL